jgi:hypothetical protein
MASRTPTLTSTPNGGSAVQGFRRSHQKLLNIVFSVSLLTVWPYRNLVADDFDDRLPQAQWWHAGVAALLTAVARDHQPTSVGCFGNVDGRKQRTDSP